MVLCPEDKFIYETDSKTGNATTYESEHRERKLGCFMGMSGDI